MNSKKMVFIAGLHRSGTSILHSIIKSSEQVSGFQNTGVHHDEGQHLQTVFNTARKHGGPGKFAFDEKAKLDENSSLVSDENKEKLLSEWGKYWDESKEVWIEKSPPNFIRMRFLQALFPDAYFITITRHPLAVSLATQKMSKTEVEPLLEHWLKAHQVYMNDKSKIKKELFFSYEYMVKNPIESINAIEDFLDVKIDYQNQLNNMNEKYFAIWGKYLKCFNPIRRMKYLSLQKKYEERINEFDYSFTDLNKYPEIQKPKE